MAARPSPTIPATPAIPTAPASPSLLILDLDGTLVDSFGDIRHGIRCALRAIDCEPTEALLHLCRRGVPLETFYKHATGGDPAAANHAEGFVTFVDAYRGNYGTSDEPTRVYPHVVETLIAIRALPTPPLVAIATAKRTDMARDVVRKLDLDEYFDLVQGSETVAKKPDPELLHLVAKTLERPISSAIMIGDTDRDVLAGKAAGCLASVAVTYGGWTRQELETIDADRLIDRFSDVLRLVDG